MVDVKQILSEKDIVLLNNGRQYKVERLLEFTKESYLTTVLCLISPEKDRNKTARLEIRLSDYDKELRFVGLGTKSERYDDLDIMLISKPKLRNDGSVFYFPVWDRSELVRKVKNDDADIKPKSVSENTDDINHPSRYAKGKYECIDVMQEIFGVEFVKAFCKGNAFKYLWRESDKGGINDIKKAQFYINKYIELSNSPD
nr:MAG TPA: nucelotide kinase [Caudoviricetes sp.]